MKTHHLCVCLLLALIAVSCKESVSHDTPTQVAVWTGRPGNLLMWGHGADFVYGHLSTSPEDDGLLVIWQWQGDLLKETAAHVISPALGVVPSAGGICGLVRNTGKGSWPYALIAPNGSDVLREWDPPRGWFIPWAGGSANGKFIGLLMEDGVDAAGHRSGNDRARIGVIDVSKRELQWVADLNGHGSATVRRVVISNDGRYVAIIGWNNGTAMIDAVAGKVLWSKRPAGEISSGYGAISPDGRTLYTVGSEGCVYEIDVTNGSAIKKRWASKSGRSEYAHRASSLAVSNDGKWLAAGTGPEGEVYVWNLASDRPAYIFHHGGGSIMIVAFSPDGQNVASVGGGYLKAWSMKGMK